MLSNSKSFWHNEEHMMISLFSLYDLLISTLSPMQPRHFFFWQTQAPDARLWKIHICYIWFLSRFGKSLSWQLQKCLWAYYMVKIPNWLGHLVAILWVDTVQRENGSFCPTTDVLDKWLVAFDLRSTRFPKDSPDWGLNSTPTIQS